ncbi:helix-turn-helix domain-containing protein [Aureivirga sp. CE67]|uniref:helix-turn-helix domain-containing protein n=1 Tax=Aureivirga sp. CE67 TaxID=1788983 RepID=UPI0018CB6D4B|nr:helix-turn-helix domain-containing protein [Aureivirga sp. CE67]
MTKIKRFKEINDLFEATGFQKRTNIPEFFILKFEKIPSDTAFKMLPYQKDFYQVSLILNTNQETEIEIDSEKNNQLKNSLFFLSPDHIYSWKRSENTTGFILYFKLDFLNFYQGDFKKDFSFFDVADKNSFQLTSVSKESLKADFEKLYKEYYVENLYRYEILQSNLLSFLFKIKGLNELTIKEKQTSTLKEELVFKFENLLNNYYLKNKQTISYAEKLNVSPSYLNQVLKESKGKTAKELINEKIIHEAKKELKYSTFSISEIAYNLGFEEPTHFTRFFKKLVNMTPKEYKKLY